MSRGWSLFVIALVLINVAGALWLLWWTARQRGAKPEAGGTTGHTWDGDLTEYNNPLPRWWLWLFYITVIFAAVYLYLYPGFGNNAGILGWTQQRQYDEQVAAADRLFAQQMSRFEALDLATLSRTPEAMATARNLFANNCSTCHGSDARGAAGFPNLTDNDWLYGGDLATIEKTIANGRQGVMPPWGQALGKEGVEQVIAYVLHKSGAAAPQDLAEAGEEKFKLYCVACHGPDGHGNQQLGAPNLTDRIWLFGGSAQVLRKTITDGRNSQMPAHLEKLGPLKVRLLAAYIYSLSHSGAAGP
jgi:cytochrome c oxidase cbb3-type subunit 3